MAQRLGLQSLAGINQNHRGVRSRSPRGHVTRVLLMPGSISNNEMAARCGEVTVSHVNGDALLPFRTQSIGNERKVQRATGPVDAALMYRFQLIFVHTPGFVQKPSDKGRLSIVYASRSAETQQLDVVWRWQTVSPCWLSAH